MEEVARIRKELGVSREELARRSGVNSVTLWNIEKGHRSPNVATLEKLAAALGCELGDFFPKLQPPLLEVPQEQRGSSWITPEHRRRIATYVRPYLGKVERHEMTAEEAFAELEAELERRYDAIQM